MNNINKINRNRDKEIIGLIKEILNNADETTNKAVLVKIMELLCNKKSRRYKV